MPEVEVRPVGEEFLSMAKSKVVFVSFDEDRPDLISVKQTPTDQLERSFPIVVEGTIYAHFQSAEAEKPVKFANISPTMELREQIWREAALGMMDNPLFR